MGLSTKGRSLYTELMNKGMIIDLDHSSFRSTNDIIQVALGHNNYPVTSTHSDFFELGLTGTATNANTPFSMVCGLSTVGHSSDFDNGRALGTTVIGNVRHEGMALSTKVEAIKKSGGF